MKIRHKLLVNAVIYALLAIYFISRELFVFHPDLFF